MKIKREKLPKIIKEKEKERESEYKKLRKIVSEDRQTN